MFKAFHSTPLGEILSVQANRYPHRHFLRLGEERQGLNSSPAL
jgi:hypothetical protein